MRYGGCWGGRGLWREGVVGGGVVVVGGGGGGGAGLGVCGGVVGGGGDGRRGGGGGGLARGDETVVFTTNSGVHGVFVLFKPQHELIPPNGTQVM